MNDPSPAIAAKILSLASESFGEVVLTFYGQVPPPMSMVHWPVAQVKLAASSMLPFPE